MSNIGMWCVSISCEITKGKESNYLEFFEFNICRFGSPSIDFAAKPRFRHRFERSLKLVIDPQRIKISYYYIQVKYRHQWDALMRK